MNPIPAPTFRELLAEHAARRAAEREAAERAAAVGPAVPAWVQRARAGRLPAKEWGRS